MLICGLKLTHDGGLALVEDGCLVTSVEMEKIGNNRRFQPLDRLEEAEDLLRAEGVGVGDVDRFVVDGWFAPLGSDQPWPLLQATHHGRPVELPVAPYRERPGEDTLAALTFDGLPLGKRPHAYVSYPHSIQHVLGAYAASPFARAGHDALVLVWDGGMLPVLHWVRAEPLDVRVVGELFRLYGSVFADFCATLEPFRPAGGVPQPSGHATPRNLDVAGKAMAYAALGEDDPGLDITIGTLLETMELSYEMGDHLAATLRTGPGAGRTDADLVATFQGYLGRRLRDALKCRVRDGGFPSRLVLSGGCALNIKWNSLLRSSGLFEQVWVPPFPNDSGAALGAAVIETAVRTGRAVLDWTVHLGPRLHPGEDPPGWRSRPCTVEELARVLHETGRPVVVLHGRAELGPRALGNRSIVAPATDPAMKDHLNDIKDREPYRPVAPICLEERAPELFGPGTPDPYMVFDHVVRPGWEGKVPAIVHLDGTARLQTVNHAESPLMHRLLTAYEQLSGIPLLCNTSANHKGCGFFPDVVTAAAWGRVPAIWSAGRLYERT
jgi:carbamoyltransferase